MIYIIGGTPRSGKTILSKKLFKLINAQYMSTDILRLFMIAALKESEKYKYFPFEKMFDSVGKIDVFYRDVSGEDMLAADIEEAKNLMPGILAFINYFSGNNQDYILEGVHFLPSFIHELSGREDCKSIILIKRNSDKIFKGLKDNQGKGDWIADNIKDDQILSIAARSLSKYGEYFETESERYGLKYINTEDDFLDKIKEALNYFK